MMGAVFKHAVFNSEPTIDELFLVMLTASSTTFAAVLALIRIKNSLLGFERGNSTRD